MFSTGLVLPPTNSLRTSFTTFLQGGNVRAVDQHLEFYVREDADVRKSSGSIRAPRVDVIILEEAAYAPQRALSMILAAARSRGTHVIATYDLHQLDPVAGGSGMSVSSRDDGDRAKLLRQAFPTYLLVELE